MLINPLNLLYGMKFEDVALKAGISKEMLIIIAIEAAIIAVAALTGRPSRENRKRCHSKIKIAPEALRTPHFFFYL